MLNPVSLAGKVAGGSDVVAQLLGKRPSQDSSHGHGSLWKWQQEMMLVT